MQKIGWFVVVVALHAAARAGAENLREFLQTVQTETTLTAPLRADGSIEIANGNGSSRDQVAIILRPPGDLYIELRQSGTRVVVLDNGRALQRRSAATQVEDLKSTATVADSDFTVEDLRAFRVDHFVDSRISDDSGSELTVTLFPAGSQYTLLATTFERERKIPIKTLYYRDTLNNAVKMQRDADYVAVGRKWLPETITMESFRLKTKTALHLRWTQDPPISAELFDGAALTRPSSVAWPQAAVGGSN